MLGNVRSKLPQLLCLLLFFVCALVHIEIMRRRRISQRLGHNVSVDEDTSLGLAWDRNYTKPRRLLWLIRSTCLSIRKCLLFTLLLVAVALTYQYRLMSGENDSLMRASLLIAENLSASTLALDKVSDPAHLNYSETSSLVFAGLGPDFHDRWTRRTREDRFPTVDQRVRLYMSNWYDPPCNVSAEGLSVRSKMIVRRTGQRRTGQSLVELLVEQLVERIVVSVARGRRNVSLMTQYKGDEPFVATEMYMGICPNFRRSYCNDVIELLRLYKDNKRQRWKDTSTTEKNTPPPPVIVMFGDTIWRLFESDVPLPAFAKFRGSTTRAEVNETTTTTTTTTTNGEDGSCVDGSRPALPTTLTREHLSPIIWKLNSVRHFGPVETSMELDTVWESKKNLAVWRGVFTGWPVCDLKAQKTVVEKCLCYTRCAFVHNHHQSKIIDAAISRTILMEQKEITEDLDSVKVGGMDMKTMQSFKVIVSLEGNDLASGLKWQLMSRSVVLMPKPTLTSWAMEEILEPWVHYVPMNANASNAEEMVRWVLGHDDEARRISERATLFMTDMLHHPDAKRDDELIKREMLRRYRSLWT